MSNITGRLAKLVFGIVLLSIDSTLIHADSRKEGAEITEPSKSKYSLFYRTPDDQMRDFATDRPDKTESAYTVDAGHIMHETDIINYTYNQDHGVREDSYFIFAPNVKIGLTNNTDIQFIYQPYVHQRLKDKPLRQISKKDGSGDLVIRLKTNMWGNDDGSTAGAVMPYVKLPVGSRELGNDSVEGGLIVPFAIALTDQTDMGLMTQVDFLRNDADTDYYAQWVNTMTVSTPLVGELSAYNELYLATSHGNKPAATFDAGLTYMMTPNMQFDVGVNIGLNKEADNLNPFVGLSQRF